MSIIELQEGNCQNCYKCIRNCPIKAIEFKEERASIIESECILCGTCVDVCPQNAQYLKSDSGYVKEYIKKGEKVYATVAPSFGAFFDTDFTRFSAALKKLGFAGVEETAIGANVVTLEYEKLIKEGKMNNIIVTACSSVVMLIEQKYKNLIKCLAPVHSPMMAHAKLMKETYGDDIKVVFIGPCISKKSEAEDLLAGGFVDKAITFKGIENWMKKQNVSFDDVDEQTNGVINPVSRIYPKPLGIIGTVKNEVIEEGKYKTISVDGLDDCINFFDALDKDESIQNLFIEANICEGGCLGGPIMRQNGKNALLGQFKLDPKSKDFDINVALSAKTESDHDRKFVDRTKNLAEPTEEDITRILNQIGKYKEEDELNCGSCGYVSCREKARAVFQGKADLHMCLPYFRQRAENMSTTVIDNSPNAIFVFDEEENLLDVNRMGEELLSIHKAEQVGFPVQFFYDEGGFADCKKTGEVSIKKRMLSDKHIEQTMLYIKDHNMYLAFVKDITDEESRKFELKELRQSTIQTAQQVIENQMMVAQEIASLLGETTAETKVALTKLKKSLGEQN